MPKVTITYTLPEDRADYSRAFHADELFAACGELDEQFRSWIKHGYHSDQFGSPEAVMQHVRDTLWPILSKLDE
jgi:hypothetical protein